MSPLIFRIVLNNLAVINNLSYFILGNKFRLSIHFIKRVNAIQYPFVSSNPYTIVNIFHWT